MKFRLHILIAVAALLLYAGAAFAASYPDADGFVTDTAGVLDADAEQGLEDFITSLDKSTGAQIAVAVIPTLDDEPIENYAVKLFEKWGVGQKDQDNGVLLVVAANDRKMRIEVGYGLEGAIPDIRAKEITSTVIGPKFKAGDMAGGIMAGVDALSRDICKEYGITIDDVLAGKVATADKNEESGGSNIGGAIFIGLLFGGVILFIFFTIRKGFRSSKTVSTADALVALTSFTISDSGGGSDSGDSGGGFDGGDSGGGGASDDW
jgi:uncharacterized protein